MTGDDWPAPYELNTLPDSTLVAHAKTVREQKQDALAGSDPDIDFARVCELRREHIRDILKARLANRRRGFDTDDSLDDFAGDLAAAVYGDRASQHSP